MSVNVQIPAGLPVHWSGAYPILTLIVIESPSSELCVQRSVDVTGVEAVDAPNIALPICDTPRIATSELQDVFAAEPVTDNSYSWPGVSPVMVTCPTLPFPETLSKVKPLPEAATVDEPNIYQSSVELTLNIGGGGGGIIDDGSKIGPEWFELKCQILSAIAVGRDICAGTACMSDRLNTSATSVLVPT